MQQNLYEFLILHKQVSLPGIGTVHLQRQSSSLDFGNKQLTPPVYFFKLDYAADKPDKKLFEWLSHSMNISEWEAIKQVNDFAFKLKNEISKNGKALWDTVGIFLRDDQGNIQLDPVSVNLAGEKAVTAEKVIREKASHAVMVGETERTSAEMEEYFTETAITRDYTWIIALVLVVLSLMFTGWYFSENGMKVTATGNHTSIELK
jgi:hypothetical protein